MLTLNHFLALTVVLFCNIRESWPKQIPEYIKVCKRQQSTVNECVRSSVEKLRPKLAVGIPELDVPGIEPFYLAEILVDSGELVQFNAAGSDVKVSGASNFTIKSLSVDLDTFTIRARVFFPHLHFNGQYSVNSKLLILPIEGHGQIIADAIKCDAEIIVRSQLVRRGGVEYIKFTSFDMDINLKDYRIRLEGLFNGDKTMGEAANQAINENRGEFLKAAKPVIERTVSKILLETANKIAGTYPLDDLFPKA